ncbi:oligosaccharide flippase family protein [Adhaeribacter soli]|uniref:oligosaccharide flippase family protein n=1 Tax=Adhaeribacter soli TaxID=2607655 RepID=UPI001CDA2C9E|nr:oligosaccharide flippase family protein [Adhaeribacter soli]
MGIIQKQGIQNTVISYAGMALGYVNTILLMPNFLTTEQVGLTTLLVSLATMFAQFSALGFGNMSIRFFPHFRNKEKQHHGFLFLLLSVPMLGFLLVTGLFILLKPKILAHYADKNADLLLEYYYYIVVLAFFTLLYMLQEAYLKSLYKTVVPSFVQDFLLRLLISLSVTVYALGWIDFKQFVLLFIGVNSITSLVLLVYIVFLKQFFIRPSRQAFSIRPIGEIIAYGLFAFTGNISATIINTVDSLMILDYLSLSEVGIYRVAVIVTSAIAVPGRSMLKIVVPQVSDYWKNNDMKAMDVIYKRVTSVNLVICSLVFIGIWANIDNIFSILPKDYAGGKYVFFFMGLARLFDMATGINGSILLTSPKYRYDLLFSVLLAALTIFTNYIFIPIYGINGAAFASMLTYFAINLLRLGFVWYVYKIQPFGWQSLLLLGIATLAFALSTMIPVLPDVWLDIVMRSAAIVVLYGFLILFLKASPDATRLWQTIRSRIL